MSEKIKGMFGHPERAEEVREWLTSQGAQEVTSCGADSDCIYFVSENGSAYFIHKAYAELFDIVELQPKHKFKPFERVLVRDNIIDIWTPSLYGLYSEDSMYPHLVMGGSMWKYCIPYEGNEHLIGTTKNPEEE